MSLTQTNRQLAIETALGKDVLVVQAFRGSDQLGRLFEYEADLLSENTELEFDRIVGTEVTVRLETARGGTRWFHGWVSRFVQRQTNTRYGAYRATIVPWLWLLTRTSDCRIWSGAGQTRTVPEIIEELFKVRGYDAFENHLTGRYTPWEFCVQYRETDFDFISRLLEQEGIYYYFKHEQGKHTLMLVDAMDCLAAYAGYEELSYRCSESATTDVEHIRDWSLQKQLLSGSYVHKDYDFERPKKDLETEPSSIARSHAAAQCGIYDYPGGYTEPSDGQELAQIRIQEIQADHELLHGHADARGLCVGHLITLQDLPRSGDSRKYLVLATSHSIRSDSFESSQGGDGGGILYSCDFTTMPASEVFRPARVTPKPLIKGPQTAIVVGPAGEEIHTDTYGRIKVKFHWDRHSLTDEKSSCWIRVAHSWAGKKWGAIFTPRIGQEVIVEFLEGDPDLPIITGRVYNGDQTVPYDLPANKTQSGIKSRSTQDAGESNFNEIRFEDKKGEEQIYIHAEKDKRVIVENDRDEEVGHDETIKIGNDRSECVERNESITIGNHRTKDVGKNEDVTIGENRTESVGKNENVTIGANREEKVGQDEKLEVTGHRHEQIGKNDQLQVGKSYALEAGDEILLQTGGASISLKKDGTIQIKGKDITMIGSGKIAVKASGDLVLKGSKITEN